MRGARVRSLKRAFIHPLLAKGWTPSEAAELWMARRRREKKAYLARRRMGAR